MREFLTARKTLGNREAFHQFFVRRHLALIGYLILAAGTAYSVGSVADQADQRRGELRAAAVRVVENGCERDNTTRTSLRRILKDAIPQTKQYVKDGTITQVQADRAIKSTKNAIHELTDTNCAAAAEKFRLDSVD